MKTERTKVKGSRWCQIKIELSEVGRLSITGAEGRVMHPRSAKAEARRYWESFFEDMPEEIFNMNQKCGTRFTSAKGAARYVIQSDGDYHGLDVHEENPGRVLVTESCGQIVDTLKEWFPEFAELLPFHLNDMKAGCEHQEALGWGNGHDVALSKDELTPAQLEALQKEALERTIGAAYPDPPIESQVFKDSLLAPCPTCGYRYGSQWLKRELPAEVVAKVNALAA